MFLILTKLSHIDYTLFCVVKTNQTFRRIFTHNPVDVLYLRNKKINCLVFIVKSIWLLQVGQFYWGVHPIPIVQLLIDSTTRHQTICIKGKNKTNFDVCKIKKKKKVFLPLFFLKPWTPKQIRNSILKNFLNN